MARFNVYLPDSLAGRFKEYALMKKQQGEEINLSQILQGALQAEIDRAERLMAGHPDLDTLVDVAALRARFDQHRQNLYRAGYEIGAKQANRLDYAQYRYCESVGWDVEKVGKNIPDQQARDELFDIALPEGDMADQQQRGPDAPPRSWDDNPEFVGVMLVMEEGFVAAVRQAWELIQGAGPETSKRTKKA